MARHKPLHTVNGQRIRRSYDIERDQDGMPCRLLWNGDFVRTSVTYLACPRCGSNRMQDNRCLSCWHDARNEGWRRVTSQDLGLEMA